MFAGERMFAGSGVGNLSAMPGSMFSKPGYGPARQVTLKRVATAPIETGVAVEFAQV
jgi:hypothetical protein